MTVAAAAGGAGAFIDIFYDIPSGVTSLTCYIGAGGNGGSAGYNGSNGEATYIINNLSQYLAQAYGGYCGRAPYADIGGAGGNGGEAYVRDANGNTRFYISANSTYGGEGGAGSAEIGESGIDSSISKSIMLPFWKINAIAVGAGAGGGSGAREVGANPLLYGGVTTGYKLGNNDFSLSDTCATDSAKISVAGGGGGCGFFSSTLEYLSRGGKGGTSISGGSVNGNNAELYGAGGGGGGAYYYSSSFTVGYGGNGNSGIIVLEW
ncbi:MAG: hypothetical protein MZW92_31385 [Comamonadaceae bacterium]|nr:hypothetical protein [Comamonadaceae bacterium]